MGWILSPGVAQAGVCGEVIIFFVYEVRQYDNRV
jgi:hypothetical protein